jgi:hypothetical protein
VAATWTGGSFLRRVSFEKLSDRAEADVEPADHVDDHRQKTGRLARSCGLGPQKTTAADSGLTRIAAVGLSSVARLKDGRGINARGRFTQVLVSLGSATGPPARSLPATHRKLGTPRRQREQPRPQQPLRSPVRPWGEQPRAKAVGHPLGSACGRGRRGQSDRRGTNQEGGQATENLGSGSVIRAFFRRTCSDRVGASSFLAPTITGLS